MFLLHAVTNWFLLFFFFVNQIVRITVLVHPLHHLVHESNDQVQHETCTHISILDQRFCVQFFNFSNIS
jgi:hypothetical protein